MPGSSNDTSARLSGPACTASTGKLLPLPFSYQTCTDAFISVSSPQGPGSRTAKEGMQQQDRQVGAGGEEVESMPALGLMSLPGAANTNRRPEFVTDDAAGR